MPVIINLRWFFIKNEGFWKKIIRTEICNLKLKKAQYVLFFTNFLFCCLGKTDISAHIFRRDPNSMQL